MPTFMCLYFFIFGNWEESDPPPGEVVEIKIYGCFLSDENNKKIYDTRNIFGVCCSLFE